MAKKKNNQSVALPDSNVVADDEHSMLVKWINESDDATLDARALAEKSRAYYDSEQWTPEEKSKLAKQKQAPTVINRIKPKIDGLMGLERANRTTAKAFPRTPKHTEGATAATEAVRFVLQDNLYERKRSDAWENLLIEGTGGLEIIVKPKGDEEFKILIRHIMWDRLLYDPHSRRKDFSDAKYLGQVVWMDYDDALALYPEARDVLEAMQTGSDTYDDKPRWMDNTRKRVKIVEMYYQRSDGDWYYCCFTRGGFCKSPKISPYKNEEGETEHAYEFASPFVDREGGRYGAVKQLLDIQDEINKRRSKALHLLSVRQTFGTAGAVADVNKARAELAKPDGHVEFAYGELNKDFGILPTADMVAGQFNLLGEAKMEIDSIGANAATMGKDKTIQSGVALRQRALTGQTELAPMFDILKNLDIRVYRKAWNRIKQYWKSEMWLRVTDDENNLKFVGLNKPVTRGEQMLKEAQAQGAPPEMLAQLQQRMAMDPMMKEIVSTENDIVNLDVDIVMDDAPDTVTQEVEDFQAMAEMVKSGFPLPPEAVIMASPLSNKDRIIKMMKEQPQLPREHQEAMKKMQEEAEKLAGENQALKADQQLEAAKLQQKAQSDAADFKLRAQVQAEELKLQRERVEAEIQLKMMQTEADFKIESMRANSQREQGEQKLQFDMACRAKDEEAKLSDRARQEEAPLLENAMPQFVQSLAAITETFAQVMTKAMDTFSAESRANQQFQAALIAEMGKPRRIELGQIRRDGEGQLVGASAVQTIQ